VRALVLCAVIVAAQPPPPITFAFHHVHLNQRHAPTDLLAFYERLFDRPTTARTRIAGIEAIRSGRTLLLVERLPAADAAPTALWHFGWGSVSLNETYLAHGRHGVAWEPPLPADQFHLHLRSVIPMAAAAWYREMLGAIVHTTAAPPSHDAPLPPPEHRMPEAVAWIGDIALLIYRFDPPLTSTRGQAVDHIAVATPDVAAAVSSLRRRGVAVLGEPSEQQGIRHAMIEGPDRMVIELLQAPEE
jgi:hypothetical protein